MVTSEDKIFDVYRESIDKRLEIAEKRHDEILNKIDFMIGKIDNLTNRMTIIEQKDKRVAGTISFVISTVIAVVAVIVDKIIR